MPQMGTKVGGICSEIGSSIKLEKSAGMLHVKAWSESCSFLISLISQKAQETAGDAVVGYFSAISIGLSYMAYNRWTNKIYFGSESEIAIIAKTHVCNDTFHQLPAAKTLLSIAVEAREQEVIGKTFGDVLEMSIFAYFEVSHRRSLDHVPSLHACWSQSYPSCTLCADHHQSPVPLLSPIILLLRCQSPSITRPDLRPDLDISLFAMRPVLGNGGTSLPGGWTSFWRSLVWFDQGLGIWIELEGGSRRILERVLVARYAE